MQITAKYERQIFLSNISSGVRTVVKEIYTRDLNLSNTWKCKVGSQGT